jgi:hypothetical protein
VAITNDERKGEGLISKKLRRVYKREERALYLKERVYNPPNLVCGLLG